MIQHQKTKNKDFNPNSAGLLNVAPRNTVNNHFFVFLKVYDEVGKVKKFWNSRLLF